METGLPEEVKKLNNKYIAVHIRRTDHSKLAKKNNSFTNDKQFMTFINNNKGLYLYLATDNRKTQNIFYKKYLKV